MNYKYFSLHSYLTRFPLFIGILLTMACYIFHFSFVDIGLMLVVSSLIYIYTNSKNFNFDPDLIPCLHFNRHQILAINCAFIFTVLLLLLNYAMYENNLLFYALILVLFGLISFELIGLSYSNSSEIFLSIFKILIIATFLRWNIYFQYPSYVGVDPWYHSAIISETLEYGHLQTDYSYVKYPITHLLISVGSIIINADIKSSMIFTVGIFEIISILYIFFVGKLLFSVKSGLLASLLVAASGYHISWGYYIIPMSLGLGFFSLLVYLLFKWQSSKKIAFNTLSLFFLLLLILTHTISNTISLLFIFIFCFISIIYQNSTKNNSEDGNSDSSSIPLYLLFVGIVSTLGYWMYSSGFLGYVVLSIKEALQTSEVQPLVANSAVISSFERELNRIELLLFLAFALIGSLFSVLRGKLKIFDLILIANSLVFIFIIFLSVAVGIDSILPDRWYAFLYIILANISALGIFYIVSFLEGNGSKSLALCAIIIIFTAFSISGAAANGGSALYSQEKIRNALTNPELTSYNSLSRIHSGNFSSDAYSNRYFNYVAKRSTYDISPDFTFAFPDRSYLLALRSLYLSSNLVQVSIHKEKDDSGGYQSTCIKFDLNLTTLDNSYISKIFDSYYVQGYTVR